MKTFSVEQGIEVQTNQLKDWKQLLKDEVYKALELYAKKDNHKAIDGYDIRRGVDLSNFVGNYLYHKRQGLLDEILGLK
jgi:hypothetical protein